MTEIPEHLLERSRARRAALGLGGGEGEAAPAATPAAAPATTEGAAATPAPARAAAPAPLAVKAPEVVLSPYAQAAIARKKIPVWAVPVLLFLPLWGFLYWGTLDPPPVEAHGPAALGGEIYSSSCASCHGAGGAGSAAIPGLLVVTETFPDYQSHVWWVVNGSFAVPPGAPYGNPDRPGGPHLSAGGMPPWGAALSAQELLAVVYYEREHFGGASEEELAELEAIYENAAGAPQFAEATSLDEVTATLAELVPEGFAPPAG